MFSWLINQFIGNIPTWVWPAGAGAATLLFFMAGILSHIPNVRPYAIFIKPISFIAILLCVFMYGGSGVAAILQENIKLMQGKVDEAESAQKVGNTEIKTVYVDRVKTVKETQVVVQEKIKEVEKKINADCRVDPEAIDILNQAARGGN